MELTPRDVASIAALLGHQLRVEPRRAVYVAKCTCGYSTTRRRTVADAVESAQVHQVRIVQQFRSSGRKLPARVNTRLPGDTPDEERMFETPATAVS